MLKVENIEVWGFEHAIRGMRNPKNSWAKSDSSCSGCSESGDMAYRDCECCEVYIGQNDLDLMKRLCRAGDEHRKFLRQIFISMDITSNHFWWPEMDTYKVGVVRNSCSKMHTIHVKPFSLDDFSMEGIDELGGRTRTTFLEVVAHLEYLRQQFNETKDRRYWRAMLEMLPMGYNLRATVTMSYENAIKIIKQRTGHKLDEWSVLIEKLLELPYLKEIADL